MRQLSTLAAAVLLLAVAALLPGAAQAYEFDMVSCSGTAATAAAGVASLPYCDSCTGALYSQPAAAVTP